MTVGRVRLGTVAALAGAAAAFTGAAVAVVAPASPAAAATSHVGIVVRFPGGSARSACTTTGGTGLAVLERAFAATVPTNGPYAGFVVQINGTGKNPPDTTHYWSYWHSSGSGRWVYSGTGAGSYRPGAGTVEGWSYVNGQGSPPPPPAVSYAGVCGTAAPTPDRSATPSTTAHRPPRPANSTPVTHGAPRRSTSPRPPRSAPAQARGGRSSSGPRAAATRAPRPPATGRPTSVAGTVAPTSGPPAPARSAPGSTRGPVASRAAEQPVRAAEPARHRSAAGLPGWTTALGLLLVVALGCAAWVRMRRRPE